MATVIAGDEGRNLFPMRYIADLFKDQTLQQLQINMMTQRIWPYEVYPGYRVRNERRKTLGGWVSTGEGAKSFEGSVIEADENTGMVTMSFRFNDYMQYVDIGVGAWVRPRKLSVTARCAIVTAMPVGSPVAAKHTDLLYSLN